MRKIFLLLALVAGFAFAQDQDAAGPAYPEILVLVGDFVDGRKQEGRISAGEIEKFFESYDFPVIRNENAYNINTETFVPVFNVHPGVAAKAGRDYGAEAVIAGRATCNRVDTSVPYGPEITTYEALIEARAVRVSDGRVLAMDRVNSTASGTDMILTAKNALEGAANGIAKSFLRKVAWNWRKGSCREKAFWLLCRNADAAKVELLKKAIGFMKGVSLEGEQPLPGDETALRVLFLGDSEELARMLVDLEAPIVDVKSITADKIELTFIEKKKDFTKEE